MSAFGTTFYLDSAQHALLPVWQASHVYSIGQIIRQVTVSAQGNERCWICIQAGTSGSTEPAWSTSRVPAADNTTKWADVTGEAAANGDPTHQNLWAPYNGVYCSPGNTCKNSANTHLFVTSNTANAFAGSTEPTWNTASGSTTTDNGLQWVCVGPLSSFTPWGAPHARLTNMVYSYSNPFTYYAAGLLTIYVGDDHAEIGTTNFTYQFSGNFHILCIDHTAALPPVAANLRTTAQITDNGNNGINLAGGSPYGPWSLYIYGLQFIITGTGGFGVCYNANGTFRWRLEQCTWSCTNSANTSQSSMGEVNYPYGPLLEFVNCTFNFSNTSQAWQLLWAGFWFKNCTFTGTSVGQIFTGGSRGSQPFLLEGSDLSTQQNLFGSTNAGLPGSYFVKDCKLNASTTVYAQGNANAYSAMVIDLTNCDSGGTHYRNERHTAWATETTAINVTRTGGASDGTTPVSHRVATTINLVGGSATNATTLTPFMSVFSAIPLAMWNSVIGSNRSVTLYGVANDTRVPNNNEVWFDVEYLGDAASPKGSFASNMVATPLTAAAALTVNTSAWDTATPARINSTSYALGAAIKTASNPGRVFFCTSAGTSSASEPAGYASAIDGGVVADGSAQFRAGCRFSVTITLSAPTPQQAGYIYVYPKFARASTVYYLDPLMVLS